jgi:hypothetical protein
MNILNDKSDLNFVAKPEIEQVQLKQNEYTLLGTFLRSKGLNLFYYNPENNETKQATIKFSNTLHIYKLTTGKWLIVDWENQKTTVESAFIYFEALNMQSAIKRVARWREGKIKELFNLKTPSKEGIKFF